MLCTKAEISHNARAFFYPDGTCKLCVASRDLFLESGWEAVGCDRLPSVAVAPSSQKRNERSDSVRRSRCKVYDIAKLNPWELFFTLTLDPRKIDRYDPKAAAGKVKKWLDNGVQRRGWRYLLIPEHHKDGAVHMHGLFSGDVPLAPTSHKTRAGQPIYNLPSWRLGWTTAIPIYGDGEGVCRYITKYVTKEFDMIFGNRYYAGGRGLVREPPRRLLDLPFRDLPGRPFLVEKAGVAFKYLEFRDCPDSRALNARLAEALGGGA